MPLSTRMLLSFHLVILSISPVVQAATTPNNPPTPSFTWNISKIPDPWVASDWQISSHCASVSVTPKASSAEDVKLYSTLVEKTTKRAIFSRDLNLCIRGGTCKDINLPADKTAELEICTTKPFHGNYSGNLYLAARQKPDGDVILQNAQFSSFPAKLGGFLVILIGVAIAWWSKVFSRARLERDQALMSAVFMRSQLAKLQQSLVQLRPEYRGLTPVIDGLINDLLDEISDDVLDSKHFLPPSFPSPYGYTVDAAGYKAYLEARNPRVQTLSVFVAKGVVPAAAEDNGQLTPDQKKMVTDAIKEIDLFAETSPLPTPEQALAKVNDIVTTLHDKLHPRLAGLALREAPPAPLVQAFQVIQLEITSISKGIWLIYGILTALSGLAFLILNNPGFGVPLDFVWAFFWGFALPTSVQALAPASAANALGITVAHA